MTYRNVILSALLSLGLAASSFAAHHAKGEGAEPSVFTQSFLGYYGGETDKLVDLAKAFSEDGFDWRPADGIRSVRESILHVASANYFIASRFLGAEMPEGLNPRGFEDFVKGKAATIKTLETSIEFVKKAVGNVDEASLSESIKMFGRDSTKMGAVMVLGGHAYEHLGQLIAYARSSGVVPPWSQ